MSRVIAKVVDGVRFTRMGYGSRGTSIAVIVEDDIARDRYRVRRWRASRNAWSKPTWIASDLLTDPETDPRIPAALESFKSLEYHGE